MPRSISFRSLESRFAAKERVEFIIERIKERVPTNIFKKLFIRLTTWSGLAFAVKREQYFTDFEAFYNFLTQVRYTDVWDTIGALYGDEHIDENFELAIGYQTRDRRGVVTDHIIYRF